MRGLRDLASVPMLILYSLAYGREEAKKLAPAAQPTTALRAEVDHLRLMLAAADQITRSLIQCTKERDAARKAITGLSAHLLRRTVELGKAAEEIERLQADVVWLTTAHDALNDDALEAAEKLKQLRQDLADARQQEQGRPANGATVTLRLENGKTLTGKVHNGMVNGWHTTAAGRSWVPAPDGGEHRG